MAAEVVVWKNLKRVFEENQSLIGIWKSLQKLQASVMGAQYAMQALEERNTMATLEEDDPINNRIRNLGGLLYQADDLLDEILTFINGRSFPRVADQNAHPGENQIAAQQDEADTIKVAASLLYKKDKNDWLSFDRSMNGVERIMKHVLDYSYNDLPTRLKACFVYCSLFPEDYIFNKRNLISLWTAQGYVDQQHGQNNSKNSEERAEKYFLELSRRCFFEDMSTDDLGNIITCKMHPIMCRLAGRYTTGAMDLYVVNSSVKQALDPECKHISFACVAESSTAPSLIGAKNLRTLLSVKEPDNETGMHRSLCDMLMSSLICLRVLDLHDLGIEELPDSIRKLIHLRYLDLSKNGLVIFPKSATELLNLQTLKLNSCVKLKRLLGNFGQLINLKRFEVDDCDSLTSMPLGIETITQLETLSRFIVKDCSAGLGALRCLTSLQGRLAIELSGNWATTIPEAS